MAKFVVQPGADPHEIKLAVDAQTAEGSTSALRIDRASDLVVGANGGEVVATGSPEEIVEVTGSETGKYLGPLLEKR